METANHLTRDSNKLHGRFARKPYAKGKQTKNWDWIFYQTVSLLVKNQKNIQFVIPRSYWAIVEIRGYLFQVSHLDTVKSWAGIPWYGLNREIGRWTEIHASNNTYVKYYIGGHFHQCTTQQNGNQERMVNGSMIGVTEYGISKALAGEPVQMIFGVHESHGKTWELKINLQNADPETVRYTWDINIPVSSQVDDE